jgi:TPP-dependent trihydroxycyclohexane-1,2-dione (THcHDO) dehydratase
MAGVILSQRGKKNTIIMKNSTYGCISNPQIKKGREKGRKKEGKKAGLIFNKPAKQLC